MWKSFEGNGIPLTEVIPKSVAAESEENHDKMRQDFRFQMEI
jgi:hypothetical protein